MKLFNKYWFKPYKKGMIPITWEGWLIFVVLIGTITQLHNFVGNNWFYVGIGGAILAGIYFVIGKSKTAPSEEVESIEKQNPWIHAALVITGVVVIFFLAIGIGTLNINRQHSTIGYPVRIESENTWFEFHAIKDDFIIQVPSYPKYSVQENPISGTDIKLTISSYSSERDTLGGFLVQIINLPPEGDYSNAEESLSNAAEGVKADLQQQTGEIPELTITSNDPFLGYPAIHFTIEGDSKNYKMESVFFLANDNLYSLMHNSEKELFNETDYLRFKGSFRFEDVEPKQ